MSVREEDRVAEAPAAPSRRPVRRYVVAGLAVAAIVAAGAAVALTGGSGESAPAGPATATADVIRTDLSDQTDVDGTLGYSGTYTVAGGGHGRLTWLPDEGTTIRRGHRVYGVDGHSVPLFYGSTPLWRSLRSGVSSGADVRELERNLHALGYGDGMTVDSDFTAATAAAIRDWQDDLGVSETGVVAPGDVVMQPGAIRVTKVSGTLGTPAGGRLLSATGATREVTVDLPVDQQELAVKGAKVHVELPGGRSATGHITSIGTVASAGSSGDDTQPGDDTDSATIPVTVKLNRASDAGRLDGAPVTVGFTSETRENVLAVPVQALLATPAGKYVVEVVTAAGRHQVFVELGVFSGGRVEVSGAGLAAGMKVEVPRT
ncbi:peptidoglycan-binding protein [Actinomadura sp. DC4]|uniref:peptidoglycan-binding protein n=1 Tax=Actinomadura sp. DC4 TaxID=3055069 RepID=UPI0025B19E80|nr:peptidoglycan-binding protein [Actinomadura sp. DC4]MDN3352639.1 peptidoglycan-binding protein [Actinomadura sp. DC4]